jgi:hypothetical protein
MKSIQLAAATIAAALIITGPALAERIRLVNVHGYSVIDDEHLVLNGGASHHYLVTLRQRCPDLRVGVQVATSFPATTTLYTPSMDYIYTNGHMGQRCYIDTVEAVDDLEAARALVAERDAAEAAAEAAAAVETGSRK